MRTRDSLLKKLKAYSALTAVVALAAPAADAQVVYTNVEPDTSLTKSGDEYYFDLNGDGVFDYHLNHYVAYYSSSYTTAINYIKPETGNYVINNPSYGTHALSFNDTISVTKKWDIYADFDPFTGSRYAGLKLKFGSNFYYGWLRFSLDASGMRMTIQDYAYNSAPGDSILAGRGACDSTKAPPHITIKNDTLTAQGAGTIQWKLNGNTVPTFNDSLKLIKPPVGVYAALFVDSSGCAYQSKTIKYVKCDSIVPGITDLYGITRQCNYLNVKLKFTGDATGFKFQWLKNGKPIPGAIMDKYSELIFDSTDFSVVANYNGCLDTSAILHYDVYPLPPPKVIQKHDTLFCFPAYYRYQWVHYSDIPGATNQYYRPPSAASHFQLEAWDSLGCFVGSLLFDYDPCNYINPTVTADDDTLCQGEETVVRAVYYPGLHYKWGPGTFKDTSVFTISQPGHYYLQIIDSTIKCSRWTGPPAIVFVNNPSSFIYRQGDTLFSYAGLAIYQWLNDTTPIPGATNRYYIPTAPGQYRVLITNEQGCQGLSEVYNFTPSGIHGLDAIDKPYTVVQEGNTLTVIMNTPALNDATLQLSNLLGQVLLTRHLNNKEENITCPAGAVLLLRVRRDGNTWVDKIVIP